MKKLFAIGPLLVILVFPVFIILFVHLFGTQHFERLKILGDYVPIVKADGSPDTLFHSVYKAFPDGFSFEDQTGATITWDSLEGRIFIASIYTKPCLDSCRRVNFSMSSLAEYFKDDSEIRFLTICIPSNYDSVPNLRKIADDFEAPDHRWYIVRGDSSKMHNLVHDAFLFRRIRNDKGEISYARKNNLILVDRDGRVRQGKQAYDGTNRSDSELLSDEVKLLKMEYEQGE